MEIKAILNAAGWLVVVVFLFSLALPQAWADPPPWAPAHGWRKKNDPNYQGYTGRPWRTDYGVVGGSCNIEAVGAVVGGVVGGAVGSQVGQGEGRAVAILLGTVIGTVIGQQLARGIEDVDRACIGHTLELVGDNRAVSWANPRTGIAYVATPQRSYKEGSRSCREFSTRATAGGKSTTTKGRACRTGADAWQIES